MSTTTEQPEVVESRDRFSTTIIDKENLRLYETVVHGNGNVRYVTMRNGVVETLESVEVDGMTYRPPQSLESFVRTESIFLPSGVWSTPASAEELLGEIQAFIRRYALLPEEWVCPSLFGFSTPGFSRGLRRCLTFDSSVRRDMGKGG